MTSRSTPSLVAPGLRFLQRFFNAQVGWLSAGLFLVVAGAKLGLIANYGSDVPFYDQWSAEGDTVIRWFSGASLELRFLFFPHGEHTPALTRITALGLFVLNSHHWDCRVEMLASVGLFAGFGLIAWQVIRDVLPRAWWWPVLLLSAVLFSMPSNHENFLWGFQTQFIYLLFFGLAHLWCTLREERVGRSWWIGQLAGICGLFSIASGWMSAVVLVIVATWRLFGGVNRRWALTTLGVNLGLAALGLWLLSHALNPGESKPDLLLNFIKSLGFFLGWPLYGWWPVFVLQAPAIWFLWASRNRWHEPAVRLLVSWIGWAWLLAAAFAYGRGSASGAVAVRYFDPLTTGLVANGVALAWLLASRSTHARWTKLGLAGAWLGALSFGVYQENRPAKVAADLEWGRYFHGEQRAVLDSFFVGNDPATLEANPTVRPFFPHMRFTLDVLRDPLARQGLAPSISPPLVLQIDPARSRGAVVARRAAPGSPYGARVFSVEGGPSGAELVTLPVTASGDALWRLKFRGRLQPGVTEIYLQDETGRRFENLSPAAASGEHWRWINLAADGRGLRLIARVPAGDRLEISEPIELGRLSWWAPKIAAQWKLFIGAGLMAMAIGLWRFRSARVHSAVTHTN